MTHATTLDYLWWEEFRSSLGVSGFSFTLVAGLQPAQVLERLSTKPDEALQPEGPLAEPVAMISQPLVRVSPRFHALGGYGTAVLP